MMVRGKRMGLLCPCIEGVGVASVSPDCQQCDPPHHAPLVVLLLLCSVTPGAGISASKCIHIEVLDFAEWLSIMMTGSERPDPVCVG